METVKKGGAFSNYNFLANETKLPLSVDKSLELGRNALRQLKSIYCHIVIKSLFILQFVCATYYIIFGLIKMEIKSKSIVFI